MNNSRIKVILFDYGRVVAPEDGDPVVQAVYGTAPDDEASAEVFRQYQARLAVGEATEEEVAETLRSQGVLVPDNYEERWVDTLHVYMAPDPGVLRLIDELKADGYRVMLLSNVWPLSEKTIRAAGWYDVFEKLYLSCELHMRKPDAGIYDYVLADTGLSAEEFLFIDDKARNLEYPTSLGMHTLQVAGPREVPGAVKGYLTNERSDDA